MEIWNFISNNIIGLKWINEVVAFSLGIIGIDVSTKIGGIIQFFIYDVIKIVLLLCVLIFIISYIQSYFPPEKTKKILGKFKGIKGNILGALLGTVTPFCSCSSIPIFIGFTSSGLPIGVTTSFLISSPFVDLASCALLLTIFGPTVAIAYLVLGVILAVVGGTIIEKLGMDKYVDDAVKNANFKEKLTEEQKVPIKARINYAYKQMTKTLRKVFLFILIGVGIGALIHNVIPEDVIHKVLGEENIFAPILAAVVGAPIYADIFGTIPIAEALFDKGVEIGTILTFMMSVTALSIPSLVMLSKVMKKQLLATFIAIVIVGIIIIGYAFNIFGYLLV